MGFKEGGRKKLRRFRKAYISYYKQFLFNNRKKSSNNNTSKFKYSNKFKKSKNFNKYKKSKNSNKLKKSKNFNKFNKSKNFNKFNKFNKFKNFKKPKKWVKRSPVVFSRFLFRKFIKQFKKKPLMVEDKRHLLKSLGIYARNFFYSREYTGLNQIKAKKKYAILTNILTKYHLKNQKNKFDFFKKVSFRNIWLPFFHKRNLRLLKGFKRNLVSLDGFTKSWAVLIKNTSSFIYYWYNFYISRAAFLKTKNLSFNIFNSNESKVLLGISYIDFFY